MVNIKLAICTGFIVGCIWILGWVFFVNFIMYHENAHYQINKQCGLPSHIEYGPMLLSGKTIPDIPYCDDNWMNECKCVITGHQLVEAIGYTAAPFIMIICTLFILFGTFIVIYMYNN